MLRPVFEPQFEAALLAGLGSRSDLLDATLSTMAVPPRRVALRVNAKSNDALGATVDATVAALEAALSAAWRPRLAADGRALPVPLIERHPTFAEVRTARRITSLSACVRARDDTPRALRRPRPRPRPVPGRRQKHHR